MPATTPKYLFPYPVGTDRVTDGDNAMQALAERVEAILSTGRYWASLKTEGGAADSAVAAGWADVIRLTCTGAPVGAVLIAVAIAEFHSNSAGTLALGLSCAGGTAALAYTGTSPLASQPTGVQIRVPVNQIWTLTAANPLVTLAANPSAASTSKAGSSLVVMRLA